MIFLSDLINLWFYVDFFVVVFVDHSAVALRWAGRTLDWRLSKLICNECACLKKLLLLLMIVVVVVRVRVLAAAAVAVQVEWGNYGDVHRHCVRFRFVRVSRARREFRLVEGERVGLFPRARGHLARGEVEGRPWRNGRRVGGRKRRGRQGRVGRRGRV